MTIHFPIHRIAVVCGWAGLLAGFLSGCRSSEKIGLEGKIKRETLSITTKIPGRIAAIRVAEGDIVQPGDTLAVLDVPEIDAKLAQAEGAVRSAAAQYAMAERGATPQQIRQLQAKHDALSEQYAFARKSFARVDALFADSLISPQVHDEAFAKLEGARAQFEAAVAELEEALTGVRIENRLMALGQQERAQGALQEAKVASNERFILAPAAIQLITIALQTGELATPGYSLFNGYLLERTWFRFTVPENQIGHYQVGQQLEVYVPYAERTIQTRIRQIHQLARYADVTSAYPEYELEMPLYELRLDPLHPHEARTLLSNATVTITP